MENSNKYFDNKTMQEMLPDYVFDRLSSEDAKRFEDSLPLYPELVKEAEEVRAVFNRVEDMDFDSITKVKTRNLSVNVLNRMKKEDSNKSYFKKPNKIILPVSLIVIIVVFFITNNNKTDNVKKSINETSAVTNILNSSDRFMLTDSISTIQLADAAEQYSISQLTYDKELAKKAEDKINSELSAEIYEAYSNPDDTFWNIPGNHRALIEEINLNEDEFQDLLKELENAKI